jgi:radical SAM-linked protein
MSMNPLPIQRIRLRYVKGEPVRYISLLDLMRVWERALRRARVPVAYSQGFNPRAKVALACPLPTGVTSVVEDIDLFLIERVDPGLLLRTINRALPPGVQVTAGEEVPLLSPALQSLRAGAEYHAIVAWDGIASELEKRMSELMGAERLLRTRDRKGEAIEYDLRPLVERVWLVGRTGDQWVVGMRLCVGPEGSGRPDEVLAALGLLDVASGVERTGIEYHVRA